MDMEQVQGRVPAVGESTGLATRWLLRLLGRLRRGRLLVHTPGGGCHLLLGDQPGPAATLEIRRPWRLAARLLARGDLGLGEAFVTGDWDAAEPAQVLHLLAANEAHLLAAGTGRVARAFDRLQHLRRRNDRQGSRRNIAFHYDLGNDFYRLWLDPGMTYSAAVFAERGEPLALAQERKYQAVLDRLDAQPGAHILEIGCGWGGFAEHAARRGYRVTGITLSREQLAYASERIAAAGLGDRVELRLQDYRDVVETYDHVVSIEMFEAVGEEYWRTYFDAVRRVLRPGGRASLQVITIDADHFEAYRRSADFVQKYVFPGGLLPSVPAFDAAAGASGLEVRDRSFHGLDYAETLRRWDASFRSAREGVLALGFDERFVRLWRYYLGYCEAGFRAGRIDLMQVALARG